MPKSPSDPQGAPSGKRKTGDTVPALDARAAADEALRRADEKLGLGETLILPPPEATDRLKVPREALVSPSEGTVRLSRDAALEQGGADPRSLDPDRTARLPRKNLVSPHEGTVLMPAVPPQEPVKARTGEPDTQPGLAPAELVPVREMLPEVLGAAPGASEATVVLRAGEPAAPVQDPSAHEGTLILRAAPAAPSEDTRPGLEAPPPGASPHEGTMVMPVMPPPPEEAAAHQGTMLMPAVPAAPAPADEAAAHQGTMVMPVMPASPAPAAPADEAAAHQGTMVMPVMAAAPAAADEAAAHQGTMLMPAMPAAPALEAPPVLAEETRPDLVPPPIPEAARTESAPEVPAAQPSPSEPTVVTAADIIRQTFAEEPNAEARTIKVTQGSLPELRMPELPELAPEPAAALPEAASVPAPEAAPAPEPDPELPRSTLHMPLRDMPEARLPQPAEPGPWASPEPLLPPEPHPAPVPVPRALIHEAPEATRGFGDHPAPAAAVPAASRAPVQAAQDSGAPKGASGLLWAGVIAGIAVVGGGVWAWNMGWLGGKPKPKTPAGEGPGSPTPPKVEADEGANLPEQMRPAYEKALAGDPNAMRFLGVCYVNGLGVPANRTEGLKWYRRAAAAGSAAAQRDLQALEAQGIR